MTIGVVTSAANSKILRLKTLMRPSQIDGVSLAVVEGPKLVREALSSGLEVEEIFVAVGKRRHFSVALLRKDTEGKFVFVADRLFKSLADTVTSQGILATVRFPAPLVDSLLVDTPLLLIAHQLQDPGNLGTIVRSAEAFGVNALLLTRATVSPLNPKAIRASAGSVLRLPIVGNLDPRTLADKLRHRKVRLVAAMPNGRLDFRKVDYRGGLALVIGGEGQGVARGLGSFDAQIRVCTTTAVDSLNVASATAIILSEAARQRGSLP